MFMYAKYIVEAWFQVFLTLFGILAPVVWLKIQSRKMTQADVFHRESHNLSLFRALADPNERLQLSSAAMLIERLKRKPKNGIERSERNAIIRALISATKNNDAEGLRKSAAAELNKFIADHVAIELGATGEGQNSRAEKSPLLPFDWQGARLQRANWPSLDAREIDFYKADLSYASMRSARLTGAKLREADLTKSVLVGSDLQNVNLKEATLFGTDLRECRLAGAKLAGACFDDATQFPEGFDPLKEGMVKHTIERTP